MIPLAEMEATIVAGLSAYAGRPVIAEGSEGTRPGYPFVSYKWTAPYRPARGGPVMGWGVVPSTTQGFESDVEYRVASAPGLSLSVTVRTTSRWKEHDPWQLANRAIEWFTVEQLGRRVLRETYHAVVEETTAAQDRTAMAGDGIEVRIGFDVLMHVREVIAVREATVEAVEITGEVDGETLSVTLHSSE